jgi:AraC-like DNA-binding protein
MRHVFEREHDPGRGVSIAALARDYPRKHNVAEHAHFSDQLVYASCGVMEVASGQSLWTIPPHFGLWIPARVPHRIWMPERVSMRTLYLRTGLFSRWKDCTVLHVGPFLRELIFEIVRVGSLRARHPVERALRDVLIEKLRQASPAQTGVVLPHDERALAVAGEVIENPGIGKPLVELCAEAGLSVRTLQRTFRREVGIDFESWRRQVRLMRAVELMVAGRSIKDSAYKVGYQSATPLAALFRQTFGKPPRAWAVAAGLTPRSQDRAH